MLVPVGIEERIVFVRVAVRPAIDRDGDDVGDRIEAARAQGAGELVADVALEDLEARAQQFGAADAMLLPLVEARLAGGTHHADEDRIARRPPPPAAPHTAPPLCPAP